MELTEEQYQRYRINYLYHFTHVNHFASILSHGLMPRNRAEYRGYITSDISNSDVQELRATKQVNGRPLHDYVPLYFTPRNPMLYVRRDNQDEIVILCLEKELLCREGSVFTDGNAASDATRFCNTSEELEQLDWECLRSVRWNEFPDGRRKRCAEVLVPNYVSAHCIQLAVTRTEESGERVAQDIRTERASGRLSVPEIPVEVLTRWFFDD